MKKDLYVRYFIALGLSLVGIIFAWLGTLTSHLFLWVGFGIIAVGVIVSWTIRCPNCGHSLMAKRQLSLPNYCPNCGHKITDGEDELDG